MSKTPTVIIDGKEYEYTHSETILKFAQRHHIEIPFLCHEDRLQPCGSCRICSVEVIQDNNSRVLASCHTDVSPNMVIQTQTSELKKIRKTLFELVLADFPSEKLHSVANQRLNQFQTVAKQLGVSSTRFEKTKADFKEDDSHPYIKSNFSECVDCYRCVRACDEIQGEFVLSVKGRGFSNTISKSADVNFKESDCVSCGACVSVCPTDALFDRYHTKNLSDQPTQTTCTYCGVGCQILVHKQNSEVVGIEALDHTCLKGRFAFEFHKHPDRLKTPLIKKNNQLVPCSWDEAFTFMHQRFSAIKKQFGAHAIAGISSSRSTNEENYLMQKFMRAVIGTNNIDGCARVCHAPTAFGMQKTYGTGAATNSFEDLQQADCILVVGANITEAHPVVGAMVKQQVYKGKKLIVVDPRKIELAQMADFHLQLKPGTNIPFLTLFAYYIIKNNLVADDFVNSRTEGFEDFKKHILEQDPEELSRLCDVSKDMVESAAKLYAQSKNSMSFHGLGLTEHIQGSHGVMLLSSIAMMTGNVGRPGVGINPLRGQNNVQGMADMGVQPHQGPGYLDVFDPAVQAHYKKHYGVQPATDVGLKLPEMLAAATAQDLKALWLIGEDIMQTDPDSRAVGIALDSLDFLVVQELFLTETAKKADIVLPVACFFEKDGTFTNAERRVQKVNKIFEPPQGVKTDAEIIVQMMHRFGYMQKSAEGPEVLKEVSQVVPFFAGVTWENLGASGKQWPVSSDGKDTQILHQHEFKRGKGKFYVLNYHPSPEFKNLSDYPFILTTGRELEHYNCGSMTRRTPNIQLLDKDVLVINTLDAEKKNIKSGDMILLSSPRGKTHLRALVNEEVKPGVLFTTFHFPEAAINHLTGCVGDLETLTPEYKVIAVDIQKVI